MSRSFLLVALAAVLVALLTPASGALHAPPALPPDAAFEPIRLVAPGSFDDALLIPAHLRFPATATGIGPGSHILMTFPEAPGFLFSCTANYVWGDGAKLYLGAAGHCFLPENKTATHGPGKDYDADGVNVRVCVASCSFGGQAGFIFQGQTVELGKVAYARQTGSGGDVGNDFGLVEIPQSLWPQVRYTQPVWQGPTDGIREVRLGAPVCIYGSAAGFGETFATMARVGVGVSSAPLTGRWNAEIPSFQGDSGAAILTCESDGSGLHGRYASGLLTHLAPPFIAGTTMDKAKQMATQAGLSVDARFSP